MATVTIRQLLDAGVHFGHQTRRWNPKVKRFILTERSGIHIIDLQQSLAYIDKAYDFVKETVAHGGTVLFVGTKKQAQESVSEQATRVGQPYVNERWLGGLLTNFQTVSKRLGRMKELEEIDYEDTTQGYTKKFDQVRNAIALASTSLSTRPESWAFLSWESWTPTLTPMTFSTRSPATMTPSAPSRSSPR